MSNKALKTALHDIIDQVNDKDILKAIRTLLTAKGWDTAWRDKLVSRAEKSEKDIAEGRVKNLSEVKQQTDKRLEMC